MGDDEVTMRRQHGFTIVELLIVIMVIGILAAITIVAFNGVQTRAKNTSIENTASAYRKALAAYVAQKGDYPVSGAAACLGKAAAYSGGACYNGTASVTLETELGSVLTTLPQPDTTCFAMYGGCRRGLTYYYRAPSPTPSPWTIDGVEHSHYMIYFLGDNGRCTLPNNLEGSYGAFSTTATKGYMERHSNTSMCIVQLPNP